MEPIPSRPAPTVLLIHDGANVDAHFLHLTNSGLTVSQAHADDAVAAAIRLRPDIIVLEFRCNGAIVARLKGEPSTRHIPVIALAELADMPKPHIDASISEG